MSNKFVSYLRVSTSRQGVDGLGMSAQKRAVETFINGGQAKLIAEYREVESGRRRDRPELDKAIALCREQKATLLIAKLDRLARNAAFLLNLRDSGVDFVACDMPHADKFTVGIMALVAEKERDMISQRTKEGLAAAKRRGTKLGTPMKAAARKKAIATLKRKAAEFVATLAPIIQEIQGAGVTTLKGIARCLNARGFKTPLGKAFTRQAVAKVRRRHAANALSRSGWSAAS
jgi:DNA invertase Pin-like site-specific DNA recombinase